MSNFSSIPRHIDARRPGGIIIHVYDDRGHIVVSQSFGPEASDDELSVAATAAADQVVAIEDDGGRTCQPIYDGDTGDLVAIGILVDGLLLMEQTDDG